MQVVNPTTPAQLFHVLRRQVLRRWRKPLVVMSPKSLLRHRTSFSPLSDLTDGGFARAIGDAGVDPATVRRVLLCSGRLYYDLVAEREQRGGERTAILRIEQLYPFPTGLVSDLLGRFPDAGELAWVQDEPENMGAWSFVRPRLSALLDGRVGPRYIGRVESASPATGSHDSHVFENRLILDAAFGEW
jgi:2-oxoglutarate dehydrogenase E1 component